MAAACGSDVDDGGSTTQVWPTGGSSTGSGGSGGNGGSSTGTGGGTTTGSGGSTGKGGSTSGSGGSTGKGGSGGGSAGSGGSGATGGSGGSGGAGGSPDGGTSGYVFPFQLTPLTAPSTSTSNISLYFSVTDKNGVGVVGLPTMTKGVPTDPTDWVYQEDGAALDPKESGFTVTPLQGNALDMPTVLVLDLSGSIVTPTGDGGLTLLDLMKDAAITIINKMLPEQRMAIVTFAGSPTVRQPFTTDQDALRKTVTGIINGDGQSTDLYGAMIQAFGMWQDGFATVGGARLTAGLAIVLTDGKDNAGLHTLSDAIAARRNKRVVAVGIKDPEYPNNLDAGAMMQLATTGTYVTVDSPDVLVQQVSRITDAMSTLGRSIYTANYCTPKLGGTNHNLLFTVKGNEGMTSTSCTPATFPSTHPSLCAQLDPSYTQACGYIKSSTTYTCCTATAPYTCPNENSCYKTAAEAAAKCGSATTGGSCVMCGGSGTGSSQDTGLLAGPAIRVKFDASQYKAGQCPLFWGPNCKALQACCAQLSSTQASNCVNQLNNALGNEMTCQTATAQYCGGGVDAGADARVDASTDVSVERGPFPPPPPPPPPTN